MQIAIADLREKIIKTLQKHLTADQASRVADVLLWADMSGTATHGVAKLLGNRPLQNVRAVTSYHHRTGHGAVAAY